MNQVTQKNEFNNLFSNPQILILTPEDQKLLVDSLKKPVKINPSMKNAFDLHQKWLSVNE